MDPLTQSLMNPTSELMLWGGIIGIVLGVIAIVVGIISMAIVKKKKLKSNWWWWFIGVGAIAIVTGITTLLRV